MNVDVHQPLGVDVALRQREDIADVQIVDRDVEIRIPLLGHEAVDENAAIVCRVAQLETIDFDACLTPVQRCDARARPETGIELQLEVIELELVTNLVESERSIGCVRALIVLVDDDLQSAVRLVVGELGANAVQIESGGADGARLGVDRHL